VDELERMANGIGIVGLQLLQMLDLTLRHVQFEDFFKTGEAPVRL